MLQEMKDDGLLSHLASENAHKYSTKRSREDSSVTRILDKYGGDREDNPISSP